MDVIVDTRPLWIIVLSRSGRLTRIRMGVGIAAFWIILALPTPAGLAFALPIGTPANAIAYSSGYLRSRDMFLPSMLLGFVSWVTFNLAVKLYWPLLGFRP